MIIENGVAAVIFSSNKQLIFKYLLAAILCVILVSASLRHNAESTATPADLQARENKILAELVALKLQIENARFHIQSLEEQNVQNLRKKAAQEGELLQIKADLAVSSRELGRWLEFNYRYGYVSILDVLVSSSGFNDLINRSFLLSAIMDQQARVFQHHRELESRAGEKLAQISAVNKLIAADKLKQEKKIAELQKKEKELAEFLSVLRNQSAALEAKLNALSRQWAEVTGLTSGIITRLSTLPADQFPPDKISFSFGGMRLEYSDQSINRAIKRVGPNPAAGVNVDIKPGLIIISGRTGEQGVAFEIKGDFEISPDKKKIIFIPESITVDNDTQSGYMMAAILDNSDLTWDITRYYPNLSITGFSSDSGKITFNLKY